MVRHMKDGARKVPDGRASHGVDVTSPILYYLTEVWLCCYVTCNCCYVMCLGELQDFDSIVIEVSSIILVCV